jgi:GrpB-like predicted nucleotidyltransferase (UPF0157 family)
MGRIEPVVIEDYDGSWPDRFERLKVRLLRALADSAVAVEHIGSTAVPGLPAKPIIDIDVVVSSDDEVSGAVERLASLGYEHEGDLGVAGREAFRWPAGERRHHVYVVVEGSHAHRRHVLLRDYLRTHPDEAATYGELKREFARRHGSDRTAYTDAKSAFIERALASAERALSTTRRRSA